jgi:5-methylcytosine-specific restriction endonuclease McrA
MSIYYKKNRRTAKDWMTVESRQETAQRQFIKRQLINSKGNLCALCGKPIENMKDCTIDHIVPVSKGGLTTVENCQLAHRKCNLKRGNQEFDQHQGV